jgi:hypothetical protein
MIGNTIVTNPMYRGWLKNWANCPRNVIVLSPFVVPFTLLVTKRNFGIELPHQPVNSPLSATVIETILTTRRSMQTKIDSNSKFPAIFDGSE